MGADKTLCATQGLSSFNQYRTLLFLLTFVALGLKIVIDRYTLLTFLIAQITIILLCKAGPFLHLLIERERPFKHPFSWRKH